MSDAVDTACAWDGVVELQPVWAELARRLSASTDAVVSVRVAGLDARGRGRLASLLGLRRPPDEASVVVTVSKLLKSLGLGATELRPFIERLAGPLQDRRAERDAYRSACDRLWTSVEARVGAQIPLTVGRWRAAGVPDQDVSSHTELLGRLQGILERLPLTQPTPLPVVAFEAWGDPHALDTGTRAGSMLGSAVVELVGQFSTDDLSQQRRALEKTGILADRLSTPTLTWGVTARGSGVLDEMLRAGVRAAAPVHVCGAIMDRGAPTLGPQTWLCVENPSLVELAIQAGVATPMVCVSGWPSEATIRLLQSAREQGVALEYAGDYDPSGLRIAAWMATHLGAVVRMSANIYRAACSDDAKRWDESVPPTPWNPELHSAVLRAKRVVFQESPSIWRDLLRLADA